MRIYENDKEIKIPKWYLKLPQKVVNRMSNLAIRFSHLVTKKQEVNRKNKNNIKFYL